jgi:hypothetical protein
MATKHPIKAGMTVEVVFWTGQLQLIDWLREKLQEGHDIDELLKVVEETIQKHLKSNIKKTS